MEIMFNDENGDRVMSLELIKKEVDGDLFIQIGHTGSYESVRLDEFEKALAFLKERNNG